MLKEIKYLIFISVILIFLFFVGRFYFSDTNIKNSYRSIDNINDKRNKIFNLFKHYIFSGVETPTIFIPDLTTLEIVLRKINLSSVIFF